MKFFVAMALGWACSKMFFRQNSVPKLTAAEKNSVHATTDDADKEFTTETRDVAPAHFLTKFECFSLLLDHGIEEYESREFAAGDCKWRLVIYPGGEEKVDHISVYVELIDSLPLGLDVKAIFNIFLFNHKLDNYLCFRGNVRRFTITKSKWGFEKLISKTILRDPSNGYIVDNNCVFGAEVFIIGNEPIIESLSPIKPVMNWEDNSIIILLLCILSISSEIVFLDTWGEGHPSSRAGEIEKYVKKKLDSGELTGQYYYKAYYNDYYRRYYELCSFFYFKAIVSGACFCCSFATTLLGLVWFPR